MFIDLRIESAKLPFILIYKPIPKTVAPSTLSKAHVVSIGVVAAADLPLPKPKGRP